MRVAVIATGIAGNARRLNLVEKLSGHGNITSPFCEAGFLSGDIGVRQLVFAKTS
jgi:hypothetical protein